MNQVRRYRRGALERYDIIDRFAAGGAAEIFRARDNETGEVVAIKRLRSDLAFDPDMEAGFLRERQLAELSAHRNLIESYDHGSQGGSEWMSLRLVDGQPLDALLARLHATGDTLPPAQALHIAHGVLDGLAFAYNIEDERGRVMGLVHRDLNPRNILIDYAGDVVVCDFGAATASFIDPPPREVIGSLGYLSPEQARGEPVDARSDLFALGLVIFECVAGTPAFPIEKGESKVLKLHRKGARKRNPSSMDEDVSWIVDIACAPHLEARFSHATEMRRAVESSLENYGGSPRDALGDQLRTQFQNEYEATRL